MSSPDTTDTTLIKAIDVHGHYGRYDAVGVAMLAQFGADSPFHRFKSADAAEVARRAERVGIEWTIVSPLSGILPRGKASAVVGNDEAFATVPATPGLKQWVIVNPLEEASYAQAEVMLRSPWCVGIKIHPEEHLYPIREYGKRLLEFAVSQNAVVLTHTGGVNSVPADFMPFANALPELKLILAHLGHMDEGDVTLQIRAIQQSKYGNVHVDTSSARSITPNLIEWGVQEIGADRILFGTDCPLYSTAMQRARIDYADLSYDDRRKILSENARKLLKLS